MTEDGVEGQRAGQPTHHPADRRVAEILVGRERIDLDEVAERPFKPLRRHRPEEIMLVEAAQADDGVDRTGIQREQDEGLRLLPRAVGAVQDQPGLAGGADIFLVQLLLEITRRRRSLVLAELRGDRAAGQDDGVVVRILDDGKVRTVQPDIVDPGLAARRIGVVDEGHVGVRIERVDVAAGRALRRVAHVGVLRALEELGRRRVVAVLDIQPGDGSDLDRGQRQNDADEDRNPAEDALLHHRLVSPWYSGWPARRGAASPASGRCARRAATAHP